MKNKRHIRTSQKAAAALRIENARLLGTIKAKNNADYARENLANIIEENNATEITACLLTRNKWQALYANCKAAEFVKGTFRIKFTKNLFGKVEFVGNCRDNRIELRKPTITVGEVNAIMQMFESTERIVNNKY